MSSLLNISILSPSELFRSWTQTQAPTQQVQTPSPAPQPQLLQTPISPPLSLLRPLPAKAPKAATPLAFVDPQTQAVPQLNLPPRPANAISGSQFWESVKGLDRPAREKAIQAQILSGNVPEHLRHFKPIEMNAKGPDGQTHHAQAFVTPDYLAIGSSSDYVLVPMSPITGQAIADATGTTLPTRKMVDAVYHQAEIKLSPRPQKPGPQMMSIPYYERHDKTIQKQREASGAQPGQLIAGHKKDVVISNRLNQHPHSVAIYGWHQLNGKNIQPLSTVHVNTYADYSHGVRLVAPTVYVDGQAHDTTEVLANPKWAALLSDEGVIANPRATRP